MQHVYSGMFQPVSLKFRHVLDPYIIDVFVDRCQHVPTFNCLMYF